MSDRLQLIAMHGWCGDQRSWDPWRIGWEQQGWSWCCGERGYGGLAPQQPTWRAEPGLKVVIAHSLGPHLLPAALLAEADAVVLLTSFGRFVPAGKAGRALQTALSAMAAQLAGPNPQAMLHTFLQRVAAPASAEALQATPAAEPLPAGGLARLQHDLKLLADSRALPAGFPSHAKVLLVQAGADQIVVPEARQLLELALPKADLLTFQAAGHALIGTPCLALVNAWLKALCCP